MHTILSPIKIFLWGLWSVVCILFSFIVYLLTFNQQYVVNCSKYIWAPIALFIPGEKLKIIHNEKVDYSKPYIYISNHQSFLDIPSIIHAVKAPLYFVAKKELKKLPFLGWYISISGMIFIDRSNRNKAIESMRKAGEMIRNGKSVLTFPEGTRTKTGDLLPFKKGAFVMAISAKTPIVPIVIKGTGKIFPATKVQFKPGKATIKILEPIDTTSYTKETVGELISKCEQLIKKEYETLEV